MNRPTSDELRAWVRACAAAGADPGNEEKQALAHRLITDLKARFPDGWGTGKPSVPYVLRVFDDDGELIPGQLYQLREDGQVCPELYCAACAEMSVHHSDAVVVAAFPALAPCANADSGSCGSEET
jgi:hypothetical protein